jgi:hypothetical protein
MKLVLSLVVALFFAVVDVVNSKSTVGFIDEVDTLATAAQEVPACVSQSQATARMEMEFVDGMAITLFDLSVFKGVNITAAHLHCAPAGRNGPIVSVLYGGPRLGVVDGGLVFGNITNANIVPIDDITSTCGVPVVNVASLYEAILKRMIYVNIHSTKCPAGEIRGQLLSMKY